MLKWVRAEKIIFVGNKTMADIISIYGTLVVEQEDVQLRNDVHNREQLSMDDYDKVDGCLLYTIYYYP